MFNDNRVLKAREKVNQAFANFESQPSKTSSEQLEKEKTNLKATYDALFQDELEGLIKHFEDADLRAQHAESCKIINEICGC